MLSYNTEALEAAKEAARASDASKVYQSLRQLPLADFCELMWDTDQAEPTLENILPRIPDEESQRNWTGHSGRDLMIKSANVMRLLEVSSWRHTGRGLAGKKLLDYGCGWGRLLRLAYYFSPPEDVYGVDPMERSIATCRASGLEENVALCEAVPSTLPFGSTSFDFIWSYSVFTHLSLRACHSVLAAIRSRVSGDGMFALTIRPVEFWDIRRGALGDEVVDGLKRQHNKEGFSYINLGEIDRSLGKDYGDTTISFDRMHQMAEQTGWKVVGFDRDMLEPVQVMVSLVPVST